MRIRLQEGPFSHLEGDWTFVPLGDDACKVMFRLDYTFSSRALETVLAPVFDHIARTLVDAFVHRADEAWVS